jgi:hypothetical protein
MGNHNHNRIGGSGKKGAKKERPTDQPTSNCRFFTPPSDCVRIGYGHYQDNVRPKRRTSWLLTCFGYLLLGGLLLSIAVLFSMCMTIGLNEIQTTP